MLAVGAKIVGDGKKDIVILCNSAVPYSTVGLLVILVCNC